MLNQDEALRFCKARRAAIELDFQNLNPEQRRAVQNMNLMLGLDETTGLNL